MAEKARAKCAETEPLADHWDIPDHLTMIKVWILRLNTLGTEVLKAGFKVYRLL